MKKALTIGTLLIVGGAAAAAPYMIGAHVEKEYHNQLEQMLAKTGHSPEIQFQIDRYERSYRTSTAYISMTIDTKDLQQPPAPGVPAIPESISITMKSEIEHGPLISGAPSPLTLAKFVSTFELSDEFKEIERFYFKDKPFFTDTAYLEKDGTSTSVMVIPAYHGPSHDQSATIKWDGLSGTTSANWFDLSSKMEFSTPLLQVTMGDMNVTMKAASASSDNWFSPQDIALGKISAGISELNISGPGPQAGMTLSNFRVDGAADQNGTLINAFQEIGFEQLQAGTEQFKNGVIRIELNNLDALSISKLQQKLQTQPHSQGTNTDPAVMTNMMLSELQAALPELLKHSLELQVSKVGVENSDGVIAGRLKFALQPSDQFNPDMGLLAMIPLLNIELDLSAPIATVTTLANSMTDGQVRAQLAAQQQAMEEQEIKQQSQMAAQQMLQMGLQQNFIQQNEEDFTVRLRFKNGELLLNGQPSEQLINMLMGAAAPSSGA